MESVFSLAALLQFEKYKPEFCSFQNIIGLQSLVIFDRHAAVGPYAALFMESFS